MEILKDKILSLRRERKTYAEIKSILNCATSTISHHCRNANLEKHNTLRKPTEEEIKSWQEDYDKRKLRVEDISLNSGWSIFTIRKYIVRKKRHKRTREEKRKIAVDSVSSWRRDLRSELIDAHGGKCKICGYDKCKRALEFHHLDPKTKEFSISSVSNSRERMFKEAEKCLLVCSNCHREIEAGLIKLDINGLVALEAEKS